VGCWVQEARARGLTSALVHNTALWSGSKKEMVCSLFLWGAAEISNLRNNPDRSLCPPPSCPSSNKPQLSTASDISAMDAGHRPTRTLLLPLQPPPPLPPAQPWRPPICSLLRRAIARTLFTGPPARDPGIGSFAGVILWRFTQAVVGILLVRMDPPYSSSHGRTLGSFCFFAVLDGAAINIQLMCPCGHKLQVSEARVQSTVARQMRVTSLDFFFFFFFFFLITVGLTEGPFFFFFFFFFF
jgi:hypothetical protein